MSWSCGLWGSGGPVEVEGAFEDLQIEEKVVAGEPTEEDMQQRLSALRQQISDFKVDWYVVPSEDEHQSEYVGVSDRRRAYMTGFVGSAGTAIVPASNGDTKALLFVDSRYWIQAENQIPKDGWAVVRVGSTAGGGPAAVQQGWADWVVDHAERGTRIGIDPKLVSLGAANSLKTRLSAKGAKLVPLEANLVDRVHTPPPRSLGPINAYPLTMAGEEIASKLAKIRNDLQNQVGSDSTEWIYLLPALPSIAWLLNYRCPSDIPEVPAAYAYLALTAQDCAIFVDSRKITDEDMRAVWLSMGVEIKPYGVQEVGKYINEFEQELRDRNAKTDIKVLSSKECSWALADACGMEAVGIIPCPVDAAKAVKNSTEQQNFRNCYLRDGRATVRWISWLEQKILKGDRPVGEWAAGETLQRYRRQEDLFAAANGGISASGPNAALPHYEPERGKDRAVEIESPYLIDSGCQYLDGTIDTTRTFYMGKSPSADIKRAYTRVLQAHVAIATSIFPEGADAGGFTMLAKQKLYQDGLDFSHGIGHGVGSYLSVHEYPVSFPFGFSFQPGHITTVEPGFYKEGEFGVRTESVFLCKRIETTYEFGGHRWLGWERLTQVPIQTSMVDWSLMSRAEIEWLNDHNKGVQDALLPLLQEDRDAEARDWLKRMCKPRKIWPWT